MKIQYGSVFGNYKWVATAEITPEQAVLLAPLGALQIAQRSPSSSAEKAMAGYAKRPKGFQRTAIAFSQANADKLEAFLTQLEIPNGETAIKVPQVVEVVQYFPGEGVEPKYAYEKKIWANKKMAGKLDKLAEVLDYDGDMGESSDEAPLELLIAMKKWTDEA